MDWTLKSSEDFEQYIPILLKIHSPTYFNFDTNVIVICY